jgi:glucokinase
MANNNKLYTIGIDIGGTKMSAVLFDGEKSIADCTLATPTDNLNHFLIMVGALVDPLMEKAKSLKAKISGIGIGIPGALNKEKNKIIKCRNAPILNGVEIIKKLNEKFDLPIVADNDTRCFTRAEAILGAGKKYKNVFGLIIGTGIGGGWWLENKIYEGAHNASLKPGRIIVDFNGGIGLEDAYHKLMQDNPARMAQEAIKGDILAERTYEELGKYLGIALANIVNLIDPEVILIGGGAVESSGLFLSEAKKTMKEYIMSAEAKNIKIVKGKLGELAGAIGAAMLVSHNT